MIKSKQNLENTSTKEKLALFKQEMKKDRDYASEKKKRKELYEAKEWYTIRAILGNDWANWFVLIGARERGKTFTVQDYVLNCFFNPNSKLYHVPFYWMRLNDIAIKNMIMNNAAKMFEPLLVRKYHLESIKVKGAIKKVVKKLKKGKYYVKVRAWKSYKGNTLYGKYSKAKKVKVK